MIRDYLLGTLDEKQQESIESRLLDDADFAEEVRRVRAELFDEYVTDGLPEESRQLFERRHLIADEGRQKLLFTKDLHAYASRRRGGRLSVSWFWEFVRFRKLYLAMPVAALLLFALSFTFWQVIGPGGSTREVSARRSALERELARLNSEEQAATVTNAPPGAVVSATLAPHVVRGGGEAQKVSLASGVKIVELRLPLEMSRYQFYRAILLTSEDTEIASVGGLRAEENGGTRFLSMRLPAENLPDGDYQLKVEGIETGGTTTPLGLYQFRLTRP